MYRNNLRFFETILEQDPNYFNDNKVNFGSAIHVENQFGNYPSRKGDVVELAVFQIYLDGLYSNIYTRTYKKVPEILAEVARIMDFIIIGFTYFVGYYTTYKIDYTLVDKFLGYFSRDVNSEDTLVWKYENYNDFHNLFKNKKNLIKKESLIPNIIKKNAISECNYNQKGI